MVRCIGIKESGWGGDVRGSRLKSQHRPKQTFKKGKNQNENKQTIYIYVCVCVCVCVNTIRNLSKKYVYKYNKKLESTNNDPNFLN